MKGAKARAEAGELAFGTIESFLIWKLTGGASHVTDVTNASRTLLYRLGLGEDGLFAKALPILSAAGDQQSALVGQACLEPGRAKITYGTGAFLVANCGSDRPDSANRLLGTVGYEAAGRGAMALEGSIFNAGTIVQWLRDDLRLIEDAAESAEVAAGLKGNGGVYIVPAFTGLGAPRQMALPSRNCASMGAWWQMTG